MKKCKFLVVLALVGLLVSSLGCMSKKSEAARTDVELQPSVPHRTEDSVGVYLGPQENRVPAQEKSQPKFFPVQDSRDEAVNIQPEPKSAKATKANLEVVPTKAKPIDVKAGVIDAKTCYNIFRRAYGEDVIGKMRKSANGKSVIVIKGKEILVDGGKVTDIVYSNDLANTLSQLYPLDPSRPATPDGVRPGRIRNYSFLEAVYGATKAEVQKQIVSVDFCGKKVPFSKNAGAAVALQRVATQLEKILKEKPELRKYCVSDGGFFWRKIAGEQYLSPHSFGIAIDLCTKYATYWRWEKNPHAPHPQQKHYPREIVKAFEDNGFIWGGKWHEFDIMHFEYRPELILLSKMYKGKR